VHCKRCDYPLWDMAGRVCPECGEPFSPLDYEFVVNSVRFMCPHCRQAYYGTGERGHLEPRTFTCVKCATVIDESEMVLLPTAGVSEVQTRGGEAAWRERAKRGRFVSFFRAIGQSAFVPSRLAHYCGETASPGEAVWFGVLVSVVASLLCVGWIGVLVAFMQGSRLGMQGGGEDVLTLLLQGLLWIVVPAVSIVLAGALWMGAAQVVLALGSGERVEFAKTAECFGYAFGASFLMAVPCIGMYMVPFAAVWVAVSAIVQLTVRHRVHAGRVVLAVLGPPCALLAVGIAVIVYLASL